jgi:hypothetical protein
MPLSYTIDPGRRLITSRAYGVLRAEDVVEARERILRDKAFNPAYAHLYDMRDVSDIDLSIPVMARLAASSVVSRGTRRAFLCANDIQYAIAETFAILSEPHRHVIHVFREMSVAHAWLSERPISGIA